MGGLTFCSVALVSQAQTAQRGPLPPGLAKELENAVVQRNSGAIQALMRSNPDLAERIANAAITDAAAIAKSDPRADAAIAAAVATAVPGSVGAITAAVEAVVPGSTAAIVQAVADAMGMSTVAVTQAVADAESGVNGSISQANTAITQANTDTGGATALILINSAIVSPSS